LKCLFLLNKLIKENALPSILILASTTVHSTATLAKTQKHRDNLARFKRARTVSRLRIIYIIMIKGNSSELPFLYIDRNRGTSQLMERLFGWSVHSTIPPLTNISLSTCLARFFRSQVGSNLIAKIIYIVIRAFRLECSFVNYIFFFLPRFFRRFFFLGGFL